VFYNLGEVKFAKGQATMRRSGTRRRSMPTATWGKPLLKLALRRRSTRATTPARSSLSEKVVAVDPTSPEAAAAKQLIDQLKK
jgi:hypothetical protein